MLYWWISQLDRQHQRAAVIRTCHFVDHVGAFSQDVSALSHEVGEWADDPLVVNTTGNNTPCAILENGVPTWFTPAKDAKSELGLELGSTLLKLFPADWELDRQSAVIDAAEWSTHPDHV